MAHRTTRRAAGRIVVTVLAGALAAPILVADAVAADEERKRPLVENVALTAVADLGDDAPVAVLAALDDGLSLRKVVRRIEAGTLAAPDAGGAPSTSTTATSSPSAAPGTGNPVLALTDRRIDPGRVDVDPSRPLIVANRGEKVHVVEIKGTKLQKYSLEPGQVGVYELEQLAPGSYSLRCIVAGHEERATLTVPGAEATSLHAPVGSKSARVGATGRFPTAPRTDDQLTRDDYIDRLFMFDAIVQAMEEGGAQALADAESMRKHATSAQVKLAATDDQSSKQTTADPSRLVTRAEKRGVDPEMVLLTNAILLAARNGYTADQITEFIVHDVLDPIWETGQGPLRRRDVFTAGGVILGVQPQDPPADAVFRSDPVTSDEDQPKSDGVDAGADAGGRYRGQFTGSLLDTLIGQSYPGVTEPLRNRVDVTISDNGVMQFSLELAVRSAWVSNEETVSCGAVTDIFATVDPPPRAELRDDGSFESTPFTASQRQHDFAGPRCAEFPYNGENDQTTPGYVLVGSVEGDRLRGEIQFEAEDGTSYTLDFDASRTGG